MSDPLRLLDDPDTSPLGRSLLSSATTDAPDADNHARIAKRLGIAAGALVSTTAANTGAAAAASALWWKIGLVVVALGGLTVIAVMRSTPEASTPPAPSASPAPSAIQTPPPAPPAAHTETPPPPAVHTVLPAPAPVQTAAVRPRVKDVRKAPEPPPAPAVEPAPSPAAPPAPAPATIDPRRLAAEVALLDRARAALASGDIAAALVALDEHRTSFTDGVLTAEADVLTIEALLQKGDDAAAADHARTFLTTFPHSPLTKRVRSLLARATKETP